MSLATAIQTLADTTFMDGAATKHAPFCNLLAILALSATHFANTVAKHLGTSAQWQATGEKMLEAAMIHLQHSLHTEVQGSKKAKYKDQLVAVIAVLNYAVKFLFRAYTLKFILTSY